MKLGDYAIIPGICDIFAIYYRREYMDDHVLHKPYEHIIGNYLVGYRQAWKFLGGRMTLSSVWILLVSNYLNFCMRKLYQELKSI